MADNMIKNCIDSLIADPSKSHGDHISALQQMRVSILEVKASGAECAMIPDAGVGEDLRNIEAALIKLGINPATFDED